MQLQFRKFVIFLNIQEFYKGLSFNSYKWHGAHPTENGIVFRVYAPNAVNVGVIGDFNDWQTTAMNRIYDGNFFELNVNNAKVGDRYKFRVVEKSGKTLDRCDPYGFHTENNSQHASVIANSTYKFTDDKWMQTRTDGKTQAVNIYEIHLGSWKDSNHTYSTIAKPLVEYLKKSGFNYVEFMPICEYPVDESWGYQAFGFFSPTSRYGTPDELKYLIDTLHRANIGVILDFAPVHFSVDDFGLCKFDGTALYEFPSDDIAYNEWGSKNFNHSRGEVRSFLQSAIMYWLKEFHFDGIRMDAIRNMIYWQGDTNRGINAGAVEFLKCLNFNIKREMPDVMLIAEDSTAYEGVTKSVSDGGLGFDYKWNIGYMNDTLSYFKKGSEDRLKSYHELTFSMLYYYSDRFLLPFSHDEVVHGKATILQKMNGQYEQKFPQARAMYLYMFTHPGKKLNFMGNEFGQLREWDESRPQDFDMLKYPNHDSFYRFFRDICHIYLENSALYERDYEFDGFEWVDCNPNNCVYSFLRKSDNQTLLAVLNFADEICKDYELKINAKSLNLLIDSNFDIYGGDIVAKNCNILSSNGKFTLDLEAFSGKLFEVII